MDRETRHNLIALAVLGILLGGSFLARNALGLEWSTDSVRTVVQSYGVWGPVVFITVMGFRPLLMIPSQILLVAAGLIFGAAAGTLYGALGILLSGTLVFTLARWVGREAVISKVPPNLRNAFDLAGSKAGAAILFVGTGYPWGPITAYHAGAGLTTMAVPAFLFALAAGSLVRSVTYTWFGSTLVEGESWRIALAALAIAAVSALPLLHPRGRRWLRENVFPPADGPTSPDAEG